MSFLPKKLRQSLKLKKEQPSTKKAQGDGKDGEAGAAALNPNSMDIVHLLWERNMAMVVRRIFTLAIQPGHVGACRQVCKLWREVIDQEVIPHLPHLEVTQRWTKGKVKVADLDYLSHLGGVSHKDVNIHQIVPVDRFIFILLTKDTSENLLMAYELDKFKSCVTLPDGKINGDSSLIKLGKDAVYVIVKSPTDNHDFEGEFFCTILSLDDYKVVCERFSIPLSVKNAVKTHSNLPYIQRMQEPIWNSFCEDGSLDINQLIQEEPFHEVIHSIPGVKSLAKSGEEIASLTFNAGITKSNKPTHMVMRSSKEDERYSQIKLINLANQKSEFKSNKKEMMKMYCPSDRYFLTDKYLIYGKSDLFSPVTYIIKNLSDGSQKSITNLPAPKQQDAMGSPFMEDLLISTWGTVPGSSVAMFCHQVGADRFGIYFYPYGFLVYFVDLEKGILIGDKDSAIYVETFGSYRPQFKVVKHFIPYCLWKNITFCYFLLLFNHSML